MFIVTIITDLSSLPTALKFQPLIVWLNYALLAQYTDVIGLNENCFFPIIHWIHDHAASRGNHPAGWFEI